MGGKTCNNCGATLTDGSAFCAACGASVLEQPARESPPDAQQGAYPASSPPGLQQPPSQTFQATPPSGRPGWWKRRPGLQKAGIIFGAVVVIAVVAVVALAAVGAGSSDKTKTYTDATYGYSFAYPSSWKLKAGATPDVTAGAASVGGMGVFNPKGAVAGNKAVDLMMVSVYKLNAVVDDSIMPQAKSEVESIIASMQSQDSSLKVVKALAETTAAGMKGYVVTLSTIQDGAAVMSTLYFLFSGDMEYQLGSQASTETWTADQPIFDAMIASFKAPLATPTTTGAATSTTTTAGTSTTAAASTTSSSSATTSSTASVEEVQQYLTAIGSWGAAFNNAPDTSFLKITDPNAATAAVIKQADDASAFIHKVESQLLAIKPPAQLAALHTKVVSAFQAEVTAMDDFISALKSKDAAKMKSAHDMGVQQRDSLTSLVDQLMAAVGGQ